MDVYWYRNSLTKLWVSYHEWDFFFDTVIAWPGLSSDSCSPIKTSANLVYLAEFGSIWSYDTYSDSDPDSALPPTQTWIQVRLSHVHSGSDLDSYDFGDGFVFMAYSGPHQRWHWRSGQKMEETRATSTWPRCPRPNSYGRLLGPASLHNTNPEYYDCKTLFEQAVGHRKWRLDGPRSGHSA